MIFVSLETPMMLRGHIVQAARRGRGSHVPRHTTAKPDRAWSSGATAVVHRKRPNPSWLAQGRCPSAVPPTRQDQRSPPPCSSCPQDVPRLSFTEKRPGHRKKASISKRALEGVNVKVGCAVRGGNTKMHASHAQQQLRRGSTPCFAGSQFVLDLCH